MKISLALAGAVLLGTTLTACGGGDGGGADGDYCKDLKTASSSLGGLSSGDVDKLDQAFTTVHKLSAEAPSDVKSDWKTLDGGVTTIEKVLKDAGIKTSDLAEIQKGQMPEGVDVSKLTSLGSKLSSLNNTKVTKASKAIQKHAKDTCKVDLNKSS